MAPVIDVSREVLLERRARIFATLGYGADRLRELEEMGSLSGEEWAAKEELDAIAYLLGEDSE